MNGFPACLRTLDGVRVAGLLEPGGGVEEVGAGFNFGGHVRQHEVNGLEAPDVPAELLPGSGVLPGRVVGAFGDPQRQRGDADPTGVQRLQELHEALSPGAQHVLLGDDGVLEMQGPSVAGPPSHFFFFLAGGESADPGQLIGVTDA